jgi:hypothetical protein
MNVIAKSIDSGITAAVITAARMFRRNTKRTTMTRMAPTVRLWRTVSIVASTSFERSYTVFATTPAGECPIDLGHLLRHPVRDSPAVLAHQHEGGA